MLEAEEHMAHLIFLSLNHFPKERVFWFSCPNLKPSLFFNPQVSTESPNSLQIPHKSIPALQLPSLIPHITKLTLSHFPDPAFLSSSRPAHWGQS